MRKNKITRHLPPNCVTIKRDPMLVYRVWLKYFRYLNEFKYYLNQFRCCSISPLAYCDGTFFKLLTYCFFKYSHFTSILIFEKGLEIFLMNSKSCWYSYFCLSFFYKSTHKHILLVLMVWGQTGTLLHKAGKCSHFFRMEYLDLTVIVVPCIFSGRKDLT